MSILEFFGIQVKEETQRVGASSDTLTISIDEKEVYNITVKDSYAELS